jgi:hypothetical protein
VWGALGNIPPRNCPGLPYIRGGGVPSLHTPHNEQEHSSLELEHHSKEGLGPSSLVELGVERCEGKLGEALNMSVSPHLVHHRILVPQRVFPLSEYP